MLKPGDTGHRPCRRSYAVASGPRLRFRPVADVLHVVPFGIQPAVRYLLIGLSIRAQSPETNV